MPSGSEGLGKAEHMLIQGVNTCTKHCHRSVTEFTKQLFFFISATVICSICMLFVLCVQICEEVLAVYNHHDSLWSSPCSQFHRGSLHDQGTLVGFTAAADTFSVWKYYLSVISCASCETQPAPKWKANMLFYIASNYPPNYHVCF